ncbi:Nn.00g103310.m01.CDS01 [Neocucurbitaria sp. VM-36]
MEWLQSYKESPQKVGFLDLPRELRDYVYGFAFRVHGAILIYSPNPYAVPPITKAMLVRHKGEGPVEPQPLGDLIPMALLRTCRQLHAECSAVLYGANAFRIWFLSDTELKPTYRELVRHIIFTAEVDHRIFSSDLDEVSYWWKRRFWPTLVQNGISMLDRFSSLETLTFPMKSPRHGESWRPAFFAVENKTREQRVALAANWMKPRCPLENERLRECLQIELVPPSGLSKDDYAGSRFAPDEDEEEWDCMEFMDAFELMKSLK